MKLKLVDSRLIVPTSPFNFDATFHKPDHFTSGDNLWEKGTRWQTWQWKGKYLGLKFVNAGTIGRPKVVVEIFYKEKLSKYFIDSLIDEVKYLYNLDLDLKPFYEKFIEDRVLGPVIKKWKGLRPGQPSSLYEYLIIGIVLQNATVRRSMSMFKALLENYGVPLKFDGRKLWCFWKPGDLKQVNEEELRSLKVGYRAKSIKKTDDHFGQSRINEYELRTQSAVTQKVELLKLYGVGPATVWYIMFDVFHQWDVFEHISPWEQKIYTKLFFDKDPDNPVSTERLFRHISKYKPYRALAVHYMWEDLWWKRKTENIGWLEKLIKV